MKLGIISFRYKKFLYKEQGIKNNEPIAELKFNEQERKLNLTDDVVWLSDMTQEELWRTGYSKDYNIKHNNYLNTPFENIVNTISSTKYEHLNEKELITVLYQMLFIFTNVINESEKMFGHINTDFSLLYESIKYANTKSNNGQEYSSLEEKLIQDINPNNNMSLAIQHSYSPMVFCMSEKEKVEQIHLGARIIHIKTNGLLYLLNNLSNIRIPTHCQTYQYKKKNQVEQDWYNFNAKQKTKYSLSEYLAELHKTTYMPFFIHCDLSKITLKDKYHEYENILKNDSFFIKNRKYNREWISAIEFEYLSKFINFSVDDMMGILYANNHEGCINEKFFIKNEIKPVYFFSIVMTILFENYYLSLMNKNEYNQKINIVNSLLSAKAKKNLLLFSMILSKLGYKVYSYGNNTIKVLLDKTQNKEELKQICNKHNFYIF